MSGTALTGDTDHQLSISQDGPYQVEIADSNGCKNMSAVFNATGLGITAVKANFDVQLYPNPNNGNFTLQFSDNKLRQVCILDLTGRLILMQQVMQHKDFDCSLLSSGVYLLKISDDTGVRTLQMVLER